jgi:phosphomannomutase
MSVVPVETRYICPGETHSISRSVHLSRLAAFYPNCRDCPLKSDDGELPRQTIQRVERDERSVERKSLFTPEGVRGIHRNELTRESAGRLAGALAGRVWERMIFNRQSEDGSRRIPRSQPLIVVGLDNRDSSPDLLAGVTSSLLRMGCRVIDVRCLSTPAFRFAVDHLHASAGIHVTGSGCDPSWNGLDFVARNGQPMSQAVGLEDIERRLEIPSARPTRHAGSFRTFDATVPYEASLWKHFHALRPLTIAFACADISTTHTLETLFEKLPCQLVPIDMPTRRRDVSSIDDADMQRLAAAVRRKNAHLGILIDDDGCRCGFLDEQGKIVATTEVSSLIAENVGREHTERSVCLNQADVTQATLFDSFGDREAVFGSSGDGRYWFAESLPTCDAILAVARVLEILSRDDAPFSEVVAAACAIAP